MKDKKYEFKIKIDKAWNTWNITLFHERDNRVLFSDTIEFDNLMIYIKQLMRSNCSFYVEISSDNTELIKALREINTPMVVLYEQPEEVHQSCNDDAEYEAFKREYLSKKNQTMKKKTYVLTVSRTFPKTHKRAGEQTWFVEKINEARMPITDEPIMGKKIHTIRVNYELWHKRAKQINDGGYYIGYGHKVKKSHPPITEQQADSMMIAIFNQKLFYVANRYDVTGNQALALAMLFYAVKPSSVRRSVLDVELLSTKDSLSIVNSWTSFCMFQGKTHPKLKKRRELEANLYFTN